ncbi:hypothetical protein [Thiolapillus sp.]
MEFFTVISKTSLKLAEACGGNPVLTTATIMLFYVFFNMFEASVEIMLFGDRFTHWLDPIFSLLFIAYSAHTVVACAVYNSEKNN